MAEFVAAARLALCFLRRSSPAAQDAYAVVATPRAQIRMLLQFTQGR